jgi:hypothetical protein
MGNEAGRPPRAYEFSIADGKVKPLTPEGTVGTLISPDGRTLAATAPDGRVLCTGSTGATRARFED